MGSDRRRIHRTLARIVSRRPERLWIHYALAISLFFGLIVVTNLLSTAALSRTIAASEGIKLGNAQMVLAERIIHLAEQWSPQTDPDAVALHSMISRFADVSERMSDQQGTFPPGAVGYQDKDPPLAAKSHDFVKLARQFANAPAEGRTTALEDLRSFYQQSGLHTAIIAFSEGMVAQISQEAATYRTLRDSLLVASVIVLIAEAVLVFWPAQMTVTSAIRRLERQKKVLLSSRSRLQQLNARLEHTLQHDQLTGLPNRGALVARLTELIQKSDVRDLTMLLVGLDGFKSINDSIGYEHGDTLLISVSDELRSCVNDEDLVARVGGDEFIIVSAEDREPLIRRIFDGLHKPFNVLGRPLPARASIGYLGIRDADRSAMELIADAELALQFAKSNGGGQAQEFDNVLRDELSLLQKLQLELQDAISNGEIEPWFQPQVRLADGALHGAEVLARWRHPTRGLLTPDVFLPAAERAGLIVEMDHAIWHRAMSAAQQWQLEDIWRPTISLNAAPDTIADPNLVERFLLALNRSDLAPDQVVVEVLETTLIESNDDVAAINIDHLSECGIALELDDFGTGYASLSKLTQLPLSGIKLDRSLIAPLPDQAADSVVRAILALAGELGLNVVAEGIEEDTQAQYLGQSGCKVGQGYGFGKPMPFDEFTTWIRQHHTTSAMPLQKVQQA